MRSYTRAVSKAKSLHVELANLSNWNSWVQHWWYTPSSGSREKQLKYKRKSGQSWLQASAFTTRTLSRVSGYNTTVCFTATARKSLAKPIWPKPTPHKSMILSKFQIELFQESCTRGCLRQMVCIPSPKAGNPSNVACKKVLSDIFCRWGSDVCIWVPEMPPGLKMTRSVRWPTSLLSRGTVLRNRHSSHRRKHRTAAFTSVRPICAFTHGYL